MLPQDALSRRTVRTLVFLSALAFAIAGGIALFGQPAPRPSDVVPAPATRTAAATPTTAPTATMPPSPTSTSVPPTMTPMPPNAPADAVAAFRAALAKDAITPILTFTSVPPGYVAHFADGRLTYTNAGTAKSISIAILIPGSNDTNNEQAMPEFRGVRSLYQHNRQSGYQSLEWREPGAWTGMGERNCVPYFLNAEGMTEAEFWQFAHALPTPLPMRKLGRTLGGLTLGMTEADVLRVMGPPQTREALNGGAPRLTFANGLAFEHMPGFQIMASAPFAGATTEGFHLGDTQADFGRLYTTSDFVGLVYSSEFICIEDSYGTQLQVNFVQGKAIQISLGLSKS